MLIPIAEAFEELADVAEAKVASIRAGLPRFLLGAALAGAAVGAAVVFLLMVSAPLLATQHPFGRLVQASAFGVGLALVIFVGAELSTSGVMTQSLGYLRGRIDAADAAFAWLAAAVGNLVGAVALALVVDGAGIFTSGTPANQPPVFQAAVGALSLGIGDLSASQLVLRAALCNLLVCTAIFTAVRVRHDGAKLLVLWAAVAAFVAAGLEYSIASMALLSFSALSDVGTWSDLTRNLTFTVPGNIVGGLVFVGLVHGVRRVRAVGEEPAAVASDPAPVVPSPAIVAGPSPSKKAPAKKAPAKKAPAKKAPAKKAPARSAR